MAEYSVLIKSSAVKELDAVPRKKDRQRIARRIAQLADDPRPAGCQKLSGQQRYRLRQGVYRVVYEVSDKQQQATVVKIGHRKDVYR